MNLVLVTCFLLWARHGEGGALKCVPGAENDSCSDIKESGPDIGSSHQVECQAGTEWESNCHACRCSTAGIAECVKQDKICDLPNTVEPHRCKANTTFKRDCNHCSCLESGSVLCTIMGCLKDNGVPLIVPSTDVRTSLPSGSDCAPGSAWRSQCNDCVCSPEGLRHCTERACPGEDLEPPLSCEPLSQWKKECNSCWCTSNGLAMCTLMACRGIPSDMHFSNEDEDASSTPTVAEPELLENVPDFISNTLVESDENTSYDTTVQGLVKNDSNIVEGNLNDVNLKVLHDMGQNEIDTKLNNAEDKSNGEFVRIIHNEHETNSAHVNLNQKDKDFEQLTMQNNVLDDETKEMLVLDLRDALSPHKKERENLLSSEEIDYQRFEELPSSYVDQNSFKHHILKRSLCKPNQDFQNECNTCKCSATGQSYACTQNECMETNKEKEDLDKEVEVFKETEGIDHIERHTVCKPHAMFFVGCNPCNCNGDGTDFSCTNKACPLPEDVEVFHELNVVKTVPTPKPVIKKVCVANKMFIMNCNTCWCNDDGTSYFCTRKVCVPDSPEESPVEDKKPEVVSTAKPVIKKVCVENRMFIMNCNTCWCNEDGTSYFCTRKVCVQDVPERVPENKKPEALKSESTPKPIKKVCEEKKMFIMNCNTCWCNDDGTSYYCTRKVCVPELPEETAVDDAKPEKLRIINKECRPDEVFELDCNMCRCNPDGKSFSCTRRACVDEDTKNETRSRNVRAAPQEVPKACQPGQEFRMDCNKCLCDNEGQDFSCTRIDCNALNNNNNGGTRRKREVSQKVSADCVPGSVFDQGCNVCRCTADGGHATCTLKRCAQNKESNAAVSETESSFRCTPGEQFKQSCNDCSCAADGKSVYCTLRICDEDLTP